MSKKHIVYGLLPVLTVAAIASAGYASADTAKVNPMDSLIHAIAQKFNLNPAEVQKVVDEQKTAFKAQREQVFASKLNELVASGKLTQDQVSKIQAKKAELLAQRPDFSGKTNDQIRAYLKSQADSLKQWAKDNNIPLRYLVFEGLKSMHRFGFGGPLAR